MDPRLQEMLDHYEIGKTLNQYVHGCDRGDGELTAGVYLEDSWDEHGAMRAPGKEFAATLARIIHTRDGSVTHLLGQSQIKVDGDVAGAETYFLAVTTDVTDGVEMLRQLGGRYVDRLHKVDGKWMIKHRQVVRDWAVGHPVEHVPASMLSIPAGRIDNDDPSFAALGMTHGGPPAGI